MAIFIDSLIVDQFRGIINLNVDKLNHVNIIAGDNNSGKSSLLEAILLLRNPSDFNNILRVARMRDLNTRFNNASKYENFINLFPQNVKKPEIYVKCTCNKEIVLVNLKGEQKKIMLTPDDIYRNLPLANRDRRLRQYPDNMETMVFTGNLIYMLNSKEYVTEVDYSVYSEPLRREISSNNFIDMTYLSPSDHLRGNIFNRIIRDDVYKDICLNILRQFDSEIIDILYINNEDTNRPVEYIKHKTLGNMPLSTYGDGIKKVLSLANGIARSTNGVLLIDELETAIHSKYYDDIFRFIVKACKQFQVQLFVTTHNIEAIDSLLATQDYNKSVDYIADVDDISVITFKKELKSNRTLSRVLSGREVHKNREEFGFEVRL